MADAVAGDKAARREFRRTSFPEPAWRALRYMLSAPAEDIRAEFAGLVEVWLTHVFAEREADLLALTQADAEALRASAEGRPIEAVVERGAGVTFVEVGQTSVVLVSSWTIRPLLGRDRPPGRERLRLSRGDPLGRRAPPARLVSLGKAIGDATRLRILRATTSATQKGSPSGCSRAPRCSTTCRSCGERT